jgi:hypothetical protein
LYTLAHTGDKETLKNVQEKAVKMVAGLRDKENSTRKDER